jgi:hypothetical protein
VPAVTKHLENIFERANPAGRMSDYKTIAESKNFIVLDKYTKEWKVAESYQSEGDLERELHSGFGESGL